MTSIIYFTIYNIWNILLFGLFGILGIFCYLDYLEYFVIGGFGFWNLSTASNKQQSFGPNLF